MIETIISELYAGTLDPGAWNRAMAALTETVRGSATFLFAFNPDTQSVLRDENHGGDPRVLEEYRKYWTYHDDRVEVALAAPLGRPATEATLLTADLWRDSRILNEFLIPEDVPHFMPVVLRKSPHKLAVLSIQGSCKRGAFGKSDVAILERVAPHVSRALDIKDRLDSAEILVQSLPARLDQRVPFGMIVLDENLRILETSSRADQIVRSNDGIGVDRSQRLKLPEPAMQELHVLTKTHLRCGTLREGLLKSPRGAQRRPLSLLIAPLPAGRVLWTRTSPQWLVLVFDPEQSVSIDPEILRVDLGITRREADVAALLASGADLGSVAARLGMSVHTARVHLKSVFAKTGAPSQTDLVRRIVGGPAAFFSSK